ncbi:UDP-Glycosyltransferase/glycogen phosphorylase [Aspergillus steynii IBT 23096]|uniref:UDP-Glycosyltransferase/glycogen phosphorylase n=1 Tax=Aspergillus steynii IBT 23096 TaxID=1392250 RepID=A0A2I2GEM1_9EURO|nr:UDP-Glycosyltransferase/glycogen phosphorylase [Aspergillus steynii IBT 23096]PLB51339.1 UDP-Glycosyltransferase/glycogen phosphorylase [Aspergillus steynii IBT 23096]
MSAESHQNDPHGGDGSEKAAYTLYLPRESSQNAPPISVDPDQVDIADDETQTQAEVTDDGRVDIVLNERANCLSNFFDSTLQPQQSADKPPVSQSQQHESSPLSPLALNVVIHVVGSRGDVQPFVALGKVLRDRYGHRIRIATHAKFQKLVESNGLEFFNIGGDPEQLMAFMVKNPSLVPDLSVANVTDIRRRRREMGLILDGCWRSCFEPGNGLEGGEGEGDSDGDISIRPFIADAIIANPPSFAHIHCAEKLGVPLHIMFTMPWSPTSSFPHPLANIRSSNISSAKSNLVSYSLVEMLTWQGLGDVVNNFREYTLGLAPLSTLTATGLLARLKVPQTYCWSPALISKPSDWASHISISGFCFLAAGESYEPEPGLKAFLDAGPMPIYIGFGSIVVDDPIAMTRLLFEAVRKSGQRALISKGWGGLGENDAVGVPDGVYLLGNCPHDWLFQKVSCVIHHGGAGTTAAGIALGKPTIIVPFFGDQPFWGEMVAKAGAGPSPIDHKLLTADNLADAISMALQPDVQRRAQELGRLIKEEDGGRVTAESFQDRLDMNNMRCSMHPSEKAVWKVKRSPFNLSATAAMVLAHEGLIDLSQLRPVRTKEYQTTGDPVDPFTGGAIALMGSIGSIGVAIVDMPRQVVKSILETDRSKQSPRSGSNPSTSDLPAPSNETSDQNVDDRRQSDKETVVPANNDPSDLVVDDPRQEGVERLRGGKKSSSKTFKYGLFKEVSGQDDIAARRSKASDAIYRQAPEPRDSVASDAARGAGKGMGRILGRGFRSPLDFTMGISKGFRNIPKMYGDTTSREVDQVTGFHSGLRTAGKELGLGFYNGITGIFTQPIRGLKQEGFSGFVKGIGKGVGGVVFKPGAAIWAIPAYTFQGVYEEVQKYFGSGLASYIATTRYMEGKLGADRLTEDERQQIVQRWLSREQREHDLIEWWRASQRRRRERLSRGHSMSTSSSTELDPGFAGRGPPPELPPRNENRDSYGIINSGETTERDAILVPELDGTAALSDRSSHGGFDSGAPPAYDQGTSRQHEEFDQISEEEQMRKALELSLLSEAERQSQLEQSQREEEIVMEYMRKASLAEAEMKEKMKSGH